MPVLPGAVIRDSSVQVTLRCFKKTGIGESMGGEARINGIS